MELYLTKEKKIPERPCYILYGKIESLYKNLTRENYQSKIPDFIELVKEFGFIQKWLKQEYIEVKSLSFNDFHSLVFSFKEFVDDPKIFRADVIKTLKPEMKKKDILQEFIKKFKKMNKEEYLTFMKTWIRENLEYCNKEIYHNPIINIDTLSIMKINVSLNNILEKHNKKIIRECVSKKKYAPVYFSMITIQVV